MEILTDLNFPDKLYFQDLHRLLTPKEKSTYLELFPSALEKEKRLQAEYPTKNKPSGWQTTDPLNHDPNSFRYIVHAIINTLDNDYIASLLEKPARTYRMRKWMSLAGFLSREMISCTLIDEVHRGTYDQRKALFHGFILKVSEENILAIAPGDMLKITQEFPDGRKICSRQESEEKIRESIKRKNTTTSAQDFLDKGVNPNYNEIVVDGIGLNGRQIGIEALFLIVDPILEIPLYELYTRLKWHPLEIYDRILDPIFKPKLGEDIRWEIMEMRKRYQEARILAQLLNIPIVHIPLQL